MSLFQSEDQSEYELCEVDEWDAARQKWISCDRRAYSKGLCNKHYQRLRINGVRFGKEGERNGALPIGVRLRWEKPESPIELGLEDDVSLSWCNKCTSPSPSHIGLCERHKRELEVAIAKWDAAPNIPKKECMICGGPHYAKGYCRRHYQQRTDTSWNKDLEIYIEAVHPPDGNYSELDGCGIAEPSRRRLTR